MAENGISLINAGPRLNAGLEKMPGQNCRILNKRRGRLIKKIRYCFIATVLVLTEFPNKKNENSVKKGQKCVKYVYWKLWENLKKNHQVKGNARRFTTYCCWFWVWWCENCEKLPKYVCRPMHGCIGLHRVQACVITKQWLTFIVQIIYLV